MAFTPPHGFWNSPQAYMGFVGFVKLSGGNIVGNDFGASGVTHGDYTIRATTADINLTQEITKPDVVDSRYDKTVYQLGPKLVDGSVSFPVVYEVDPSTNETLFEILYRYAVTRQNNGLLSPFELQVKYTSSFQAPNSEAEFLYQGCIVNTFQFAVAQSDVVTCTFDIIGVDRQPATNLTPPPRRQLPGCAVGADDSIPEDSTASGSIGTTRIVTWNDARVEINGPNFAGPIGGQFVRTFEANINNDAERFYTLNTLLVPQAIAPRKRDVTGSVTLIGRHPDLGAIARNNENHCTTESLVKFGYSTPSTGDGCSESTFNVTLPNCIFEIETMSLSNDLFESTVNWHSLPAAGTGVCDPLLANLGNTVFNYEGLA